MARHFSNHQIEDQKRLRSLWESRKRILGLTQLQAAREFGVNQTAISQWLHGRTALHFEAIIKFSRLLGVSVEDISPSTSDFLRGICITRDQRPSSLVESSSHRTKGGDFLELVIHFEQVKKATLSFSKSTHS